LPKKLKKGESGTGLWGRTKIKIKERKFHRDAAAGEKRDGRKSIDSPAF
jgi:hypothetical protein